MASSMVSADHHYGGYSRFELELEFVEMLGNPAYLNYLASIKMFESDEFVNYLRYLQYWSKPKHVKYLQHPGPTLRALELLQQESFRKSLLNPAFINQLAAEGMERVVPTEQP